MKKKILSIMLSLALVLTMTPMMGGTAYAEGTWSGIHWEVNEACWDAYEGADGYWVYLEKTGSNPYVGGFYAGGTRIDFEEQMLLMGTDTYRFYVVPHFDGAYHDDLRSGYSELNVYIAPTLNLYAPVNLRWNGNTAEWDAVEDAKAYTLDLYKDGALIKSDITVRTNSYINLTDCMETYGEGAYTFKVASQGAGETGDFSAESSVLNYTLIPIPGNLHWEGNVAKWDAVPGADLYWIRIYKEGTQLYAGAVNTNKYNDVGVETLQ